MTDSTDHDSAVLDWPALDRYLAGESTPAEADVIRARLATLPEGETLVRELRAQLRGAKSTPLDVRATWSTLQETVRAEETRSRPARRRVHVSWNRASARGGVWIAAAGIAIAALGLVTGWQARGFRGRARPAGSVSYATTNGQRANITLPDGSTAILNVASRLEVPADYATGNHVLRLSGEALFTVRRHGVTPFTVVSGDATARVLGTSFVVRHYPTDTATVVAVRDGKVAVQSVVLTAHEQVAVARNVVGPIRQADGTRFGFTAGVLTLADAPLSSAIADLNRWYDADVRLGTATLASQRINGNFAPGSVAELANILELMLGVRVERHGRTLTLYQN